MVDGFGLIVQLSAEAHLRNARNLPPARLQQLSEERRLEIEYECYADVGNRRRLTKGTGEDAQQVSKCVTVGRTWHVDQGATYITVLLATASIVQAAGADKLDLIWSGVHLRCCMRAGEGLVALIYRYPTAKWRNDPFEIDRLLYRYWFLLIFGVLQHRTGFSLLVILTDQLFHSGCHARTICKMHWGL